MTQISRTICPIVSLLIFLAMNAYAQPYPSSKKHLEQLIREGSKNNYSGVYTIQACNEDSLFYKQDTIRFYDDPDYYSKIGICCEFIEWEFSDDDLIRQQEPQTCMDPSSLLVSSIRYYKYRIEKHNRKIFLNLYTDKKTYNSFLLQNIEYFELPGENNCRGITLIRQRPVIPKIRIQLPNPVKMTTPAK